jgi:CxxC-x17-CxxC domain-containing protein
MDKQMYHGDWKCCGCGKAITELPFEPKVTNNLTCRECYASGKVAPKSNSGDGERKMFAGDWKCSKCGCPITKLPFEPKATNNLTCIDCFKKSKGL